MDGAVLTQDVLPVDRRAVALRELHFFVDRQLPTQPPHRLQPAGKHHADTTSTYVTILCALRNTKTNQILESWFYVLHCLCALRLETRRVRLVVLVEVFEV